jgi:hypothetical protein
VESCLEAPLDLEARKQEAATLRKELEAADLSDAVRPMANFTRGFYDIVFGENEDQILDGIGQCEEAYRVEHKTPDAFVDLLIKDCRRAGWRRILYLDTTKKAEAVSGA